MYKFEEGNKTVRNLETGQKGIHSGVWLWRGYRKWLAEGNTTESYQNAEEEAAEAEEKERLALIEQRLADIEAEKVVSGLRDISIQEAIAWIRSEIEGATTLEELKVANFKIWKKALPYIL